MLGQVEEGTSVGDESGADELTEEDGQVWRDGGHSVLEVVREGF